MGGIKITSRRLCCSRTVYRVCLMRNEWETSPQLLSDAVHPVVHVLLRRQHLYLVRSNGRLVTKVQRYNIETSDWTLFKDLPFAVNSSNAAAVGYKNRITIVTGKRLMTYQQEYDTWSVKDYEYMGNVATAMIIDEELCTCFKKGDNGSLMAYDEEANVWKVKADSMSNILHQKYCFAV